MPVFQSTRLLDQLRAQIRYLHYSLRTEEAYVYWVKKFVRFHGSKHPRDMGQAEVEAFLTYLATQRKVSVSTHRQVLSALLFLYQKVLGVALPWMDALARPVPSSKDRQLSNLLMCPKKLDHHRRQHDDDLHPCFEGDCGWHGQPA